MKKQLLFILLSTQLLLGATLEQVEQYLMVSNAEEELLQLESQFSFMQNGFSQDTNSSKNKTYDMQLLSVRFKDYLQKHLSENEMKKILQNYRNVILLQFVSAKNTEENDKNETASYIESLQNNPEAKTRIDLTTKINKSFNNPEVMVVMFDELMQPLMKNASGGGKLDDAYMKKRKERYMKGMIERSKNETLYATKEFSIEELETLLKIAKDPVVNHEMKAVFGATAYALKEFFLSLASRYDISKH